MSEEHTLTNNDAQHAIFNTPFHKELDERIPPSVLAEKWKSLMEAEETKVFHHEGRIVYSKPVQALQVQLLATDKVTKLKGYYPNPALSFEGANGQKVSFEIHLGGEEDGETDS
jgi:hypothetical protein